MRDSEVRGITPDASSVADAEAARDAVPAGLAAREAERSRGTELSRAPELSRGTELSRESEFNRGPELGGSSKPAAARVAPSALLIAVTVRAADRSVGMHARRYLMAFLRAAPAVNFGTREAAI